MAVITDVNVGVVRNRLPTVNFQAGTVAGSVCLFTRIKTKILYASRSSFRADSFIRLTSISLWAQGRFSISDFVLKGGVPLPNILVVLFDRESKTAIRETRTDETGRYTFSRLLKNPTKYFAVAFDVDDADPRKVGVIDYIDAA